ncbi:hypothetical protein [Roseisolibacter sp. H3M3-2]|uniref:hypothetical protein n=1 Tax=Roseisolibacter sp. H3M3-2 TaxID=3031323 RepID=UPI0023DC4F58|nr:hypothetical protein [Roseisolibacter sp. H3M3-2]MDF1504919.1 hypothetical protein [Roseisolibacter sp. H3M3-2]
MKRAAIVLTLLAACGGGQENRPEFANDGDTGAAAPATQQTLSPNPAMGDSTQGLQDRTGQRGVAGDSGNPAVTPLDTSKGQNPPPVPPPKQP